MNTSKITGHLPPEKKELVDLLLKKANATADEVIDNAFTQFIRLNLDLLSSQERKRYDRYLAKKV